VNSPTAAAPIAMTATARTAPTPSLTLCNPLAIRALALDLNEPRAIRGVSAQSIAHLIPHVTTKHGLDAKEWAIDDDRLLLLIRRYTREAGVRNLERELSTLIRKAVKRLWDIGDIVDVLERKPVVAGRAIEGKRNTIMVQAND
jgi:hypothetical protein